MNSFLPSGYRRTKIFFGVFGIESVKIDNLRAFRLRNPQQLAFLNAKRFACRFRHQELFNGPHRSTSHKLAIESDDHIFSENLRDMAKTWIAYSAEESIENAVSNRLYYGSL
jgi:hypothetical protein